MTFCALQEWINLQKPKESVTNLTIDTKEYKKRKNGQYALTCESSSDEYEPEDLSPIELHAPLTVNQIMQAELSRKMTKHKVSFVQPIHIKSTRLVFIVFENQESFFYEIDKNKLTIKPIY